MYAPGVRRCRAREDIEDATLPLGKVSSQLIFNCVNGCEKPELAYLVHGHSGEYSVYS